MTRRSTIGFDRRIDLAWLDAAAVHAAAGLSPDEQRDALWSTLEGHVAGEARNSARGKTVTVLAHVWGGAPGTPCPLREVAAAMYVDAPTRERVAIHWAMLLATYPFFSDVAAGIGRLLTLQGEVTFAHVHHRLASAWGDRSTVRRAAQRVIRSMVEWGTLRDVGVGRYGPAPAVSLSAATSSLLVEALLTDSEADAIPLRSLRTHPATFPFKLAIETHALSGSGRFQLHREGLDTDMVELRRPAVDARF